MIRSVAVPVAEALYKTLSEFQSIGSQSLRSVRYVYGEKCVNRAIFDFDEVSLIVEGNPDDDSVEFQVVARIAAQATGGVEVNGSEFWSQWIGKPFGWGWITVSQQGYCDGILLSFAGITPQVLLTIAASSVVISTVVKVPQIETAD